MFLFAEEATGSQITLGHPSSTLESPFSFEAGLAVKGMEGVVRGFIVQALAPSSRRTYTHGVDKFNQFCSLVNISTPYPLSTPTLCSFASYLASINLSPQTIKTYLAAVRFMHIYLGFPDPPSSSPTLKLVQRGIARNYAVAQPSPYRRLPLTPNILRGIRSLWLPRQYMHDTIMEWAAICTCFYGFFHLGEITSPTETIYDASIHLCFGDLAVDDLSDPRILTLTLKQSKTDQLRSGANVCIAKTGTDLCPVAALLSYVAIRGDKPGPLFIYENGKFLTQARLISSIRLSLNQLGLNPADYCGHSLRIGAATSAAANGLQDSTIKTLGRWKSNAYQRYIQVSKETLSVSASVIGNDVS